MAMTLRRRMASEKAEAPKLKRNTIGSRIQKLRYQLGLTQDELAKVADRGRSAVAQWERDDCEPPLSVIEHIAEILETTPSFLAFGFTGEPQVVAPDPETLGYVMVPEVTYGTRLIDRVEGDKWGVPFTWLRNEARVTDLRGCVLYKVEYDACGYQYGDVLLIDTSATRPSPPGNFLHWDGIGPSVATMAPQHGGGKPTVRVTGTGDTYDADPAELQIIGRVRALWRKA